MQALPLLCLSLLNTRELFADELMFGSTQDDTRRLLIGFRPVVILTSTSGTKGTCERTIGTTHNGKCFQATFCGRFSHALSTRGKGWSVCRTAWKNLARARIQEDWKSELVKSSLKKQQKRTPAPAKTVDRQLACEQRSPSGLDEDSFTTQRRSARKQQMKNTDTVGIQLP
jgi:hypothetical protein